MKALRPTRVVRDFLVGERGQFVFTPGSDSTIRQISAADVYIHIPFCRSLCPYCPYNRVLYDARQSRDYVDALHCEIDRYRDRLGDIAIGSIYIGGGTPTTVVDDLAGLVAHLRQRFRQEGPVAVETTPEDLDPPNIEKLRQAGVDLLSIGVQSFDDRYLKLLGRRHRSEVLPEAIRRATTAGFDSVNLDLMFALPGQTTAEALADLDTAIDLGARQVTLYPLFTFRYSSVGRQLQLKDVDFPRLHTRRRMYRALHKKTLSRGFERVSVWGFKTSEATRFSSVTRDEYIGIGAGAASCLPGIFRFNTYSIPEYIKRSSAGASTVSLHMRMSDAMTRLYWLYWRLYETRIPKDGFARYFSRHASLRCLLWMAMHLRLLSETAESYVLTERGAFWIHLMQNYYVLNYIDEVWTRSMRDAWPARIEL